MAKGYWIVRFDVTDQTGYDTYRQHNAGPIAAFGGRFLVRGGTMEAMEGPGRSRNVVIEFPSYQAALDCYRSPEYQAASVHRLPAVDGEFLIIEGYDGPQPG